VTPASAIASARNGQLLPVYVVAGDERFLRDQVVAELRKASLGNGIAAFNEDRFTAGEVDVDKVISAARTVPMMAPRRFVLVRGVERWEGSADDDGSSKKETPLDRLAAYAAEPIDSTCVVLTATKLDGRRKLAAVAKKQGFLVMCDVLSRQELPRWILERFKERGNPCEPDVADLLAEIAGPELAYVNDAIERLALHAGLEKPVTESDVSECIARVRTADTWALVDAVRARELGTALKNLADVYDPRDRGLPLLGALAWSIRQLARFKAGLDAGLREDDAAKAAGVFQPFRVRELSQKAKTFRGRELERWVLVLAEADLALKSSRRPAQAILEDMLTRLCRRTAA
jgi:DNA polymerase-3 subunit delta